MDYKHSSVIPIRSTNLILGVSGPESVYLMAYVRVKGTTYRCGFKYSQTIESYKSSVLVNNISFDCQIHFIFNLGNGRQKKESEGNCKYIGNAVQN